MILILDFGSQYTQLIARRIREQGVYCEIHPCTLPLNEIKNLAPQGVILSGGPSSVLGEHSPKVELALFKLGLPILGICYGQQLMCQMLGGEVISSAHSEYGRTDLFIQRQNPLFHDLHQWERQTVWMSHGDRVERLPHGFEVTATSPNAPFAAIYHPEKKLYGIQFHPEVTHTEHGTQMLRNFLFEIVGIKPTAKTVAVSAEMFNKMLDEGRAGDNVGILLRGLKKEDIERGQVLAHPGSITPHTKFEAEVYVLSKEEGGRHTPFFKGYRPQFYFRTTDVTGEVQLPDGVEMVMPGDNIQMVITLIAPIAMEEGLRFAIREGGRTVGAGVVAKVLE